ncbi:hypothetical protein BGZ93_003082 [Podila epicladia]|nr:hypothetical protein BGZ92_005778 [Podila epicladia]KAG0097268.1 hypothetical protein BGZ93_003082 [Podila epicladia]
MITTPSLDSTHFPHSSQHSPHTAQDPIVRAKPHSEYHNFDYTPSTTTNSPHTVAPQFDSPNSNPQIGHAPLDFIPLPTTLPSAPPQVSTTIPMADDDAKWETTPSLPYVVPHPTASASASSATSYPVPPSYYQTQQQEQPHYENVTFVETTPIDMKKEKYKLSPAAGGSTIFEDLRNPRKKIFWVFNIFVLAIIFGVLGATVWNPNNNKSSEGGGKSEDHLGAPTTSSTTLGASPSQVVPTPVMVPVPTPVRVTATTPPPPTATQDKFACMGACGEESNKCHAPCESDPEFIKCNSACTEGFCRIACREASSCIQTCVTNVHACLRRC